jgi:hypothetical protein
MQAKRLSFAFWRRSERFQILYRQEKAYCDKQKRGLLSFREKKQAALFTEAASRDFVSKKTVE